MGKKNKNKKSKIELELDSDIESDCEGSDNENGNESEDEEAVEVEISGKNGKENPNDNEAKELLKNGKKKNSVLASSDPEPDIATGGDKDESESDDDEDEIVEKEPEDNTTFKDLGLNEVLVEACLKLGWKKPSKIQKESLPLALQGKDIIGLAETGSGKTGAFALPILQSLMENPQRLFALVLTPTRELAFQISEQFEALGARIGVKSCVIVGGIDMMTQALSLAKKPHIIIATPGRLIDHLENTKGFHLKSLKFLVMDEADRILNMDFEIEVDKILKVVPKDRKTYMFSATMTKKVQKLQRASLRNPAKVEVSTKYTTVEKLLQFYVFIPLKFKDVYLVHILNELSGNSFMVFCATCANAMRTALFLRNLGFNAIPLHGQMTQNKRLASLNKFRGKNKSILISTDVASRGLDIPHVDVVVNFDIPTHSKDYIHRVGRTARAGRAGKAITFVTQYDVELYQRIEHLIEKKLPLYKTEEDEVMTLNERVSEAQRMAKIEMKEMEDKKRGGGKRKRFNHDDNDDTEESMGVRKRLNKGKPGGGGGGGGGRGNGLRNNVKGGKRGRMFN